MREQHVDVSRKTTTRYVVSMLLWVLNLTPIYIAPTRACSRRQLSTSKTHVKRSKENTSRARHRIMAIFVCQFLLAINNFLFAVAHPLSVNVNCQPGNPFNTASAGHDPLLDDYLYAGTDSIGSPSTWRLTKKRVMVLIEGKGRLYMHHLHDTTRRSLLVVAAERNLYKNQHTSNRQRSRVSCSYQLINRMQTV